MVGYALPIQLENQTKCEAKKPKLKFQIPNPKRWLYSVWYLEFGAWDFYGFPSKRSLDSPTKAFTEVVDASLRTALQKR